MFHLANILSIDEYISRLDVVEPEQESDYGALSSSRRTDECVGLTGWNDKRHILQDFFAEKVCIFVFSRSFECLLYPNGMWRHFLIDPPFI